MTNYNDGNWHVWNGGECPVHRESLVECRSREAGAGFDGRTRKAGHWIWEHCEPPASIDIIAFRVVEEYTSPRRIWMNEYPNGFGVSYNDEKTARSRAGVSAIRTVEFAEVEKM